MGIDKVTGTTVKYMFKAILGKTDPKRFIFYNHDQQGKIEADKVLGRLASRDKKYADKDMAVLSFLRQLKSIKKWGKAEQDDLKFITMPTLIVNGDKDMMIPTENSIEMDKKISNSKLILYPNSGHGSIFQYPEQFSMDLVAFLK